MSSDIKVSVCIVSYNQDSYIEQCIRSVLDQDTQYSFDIIVGDDASTDNTREILANLKTQYPDKITLLLHDKNIGPFNNVLATYRAARGEYISHLDGDDYFLPNKIEKQVSLMEGDPSCGMSFHSVMQLDPERNFKFKKINCAGIPNAGWTRSDLIRLMAPAVNSSKMFRRKLLDGFKEPGFPLIDTIFNCLIISDMRVKVISDDALGVYRSSIGISSAGLTTKIASAKGYEYMISFVSRVDRLSICYVALLLMLVELKNFRSAWCLYFKLFLKSLNFFKGGYKGGCS